MNRRSRLAVALVLIGSMTACGELERVTSGERRPDVAEFLDSYIEAVALRDTAQLRRMYVDAGRFAWIEDGEVRYRSPDRVFESLLTSFPASATIQTELEDLEFVVLSGGGVHAWSPFTTSVTSEEVSFSFAGLMSFLLEPEGDAWRIVGGHVSSARSP